MKEINSNNYPIDVTKMGLVTKFESDQSNVSDETIYGNEGA